MVYFAAPVDSDNTECSCKRHGLFWPITLNVLAKYMVYFAATVNSDNTECACKGQWSILPLEWSIITLNVLAKDYGLFCSYSGL